MAEWYDSYTTSSGSALAAGAERECREAERAENVGIGRGAVEAAADAEVGVVAAEEFQNRRVAGRTFERELSQGGFLAEFLVTGNLDPQHAPPIGYAHLTTAAEFRELLAARFEELALVGAESFAAPWQDLFPSKPAEEAAAWLDLVEATGRTPEGLAYSDHFLFVGKKVASQ